MNYPDKVSPDQLVPRKNLRTTFDEAVIAARAESIRLHGMQARILARPLPGADQPPRRAAKGAKQRPPARPHYEIIDGELRWRAAKLLGLKEVPVDIKPCGDQEAAEVHFTMFLHRTDLTPLERARGFGEMLALKTAAGTPSYTPASLAAALGYDEKTIRRAMLMLAAPVAVQQAVEAGRMAPLVATMIGAIPGAGVRLAAAQTLLTFNAEQGNVLRGGAPATVEQAERYIREKVYRDLRQAPFDQTAAYQSAELTGKDTLPTCKKCPYRSGNLPEAQAEGAPAYLCTQPDCYASKAESQWRYESTQAQRTAAGRPAVVLSFAQSAEIYPAWYKAGVMDPTMMGEWADLAAKPDGYIKAEILPEKTPTWGELLGDWAAGEATTLARAQDGSVRKLVPLGAALAAAKQRRPELFERKKAVPAINKQDYSYDEERARQGKGPVVTVTGEDGAVTMTPATQGEEDAAGELSPELALLLEDIVATVLEQGPKESLWPELARALAGRAEGEAAALELNEACAGVIRMIATLRGGEAEGEALLRGVAKLYGVDRPATAR